MCENVALKTHKIHFGGDPTRPVNIEYNTMFGVIHGEYKLYDRASTLMSCVTYTHGQLHGNSIEYNVYMREYDGSMKHIPKYVRSFVNGVENTKSFYHE